MGQPTPSSSDRRLDSWKEIAAFFERDERTVRRWEKENALPVRRVPGGAKGRVFAYESELRQWLSAPQGPARQADRVEVTVAEPPEAASKASLLSVGKWAATAAACIILVAGIAAYRKNHGFAVHASEARAARVSANRVHRATPQAEEFYLKGRYYWNRRTPEDLNRAVDYFTQALVQDPTYSKAYVGLADSYNLLREYSAMPASEAYSRALAAARKAVEMDDSSAEAHASLGFVTFYGTWDVDRGELEFKRAIALNPNDVQAHHWYATFLHTCRRDQEALREIEFARNLEPSSAAILADEGQILRALGRIDEAETLLKQIEAEEPSFAAAHRYLSEISYERGDYANYLAEWKKTALQVHDEQELGMVKAAEKGFSDGGLNGMLENVLSVQKDLNSKGVLPAYSVAETYARLGRNRDALRYLQTSYSQRESLMVFLRIDNAFNHLRDEPGYKELEARVVHPNS